MIMTTKLNSYTIKISANKKPEAIKRDENKKRKDTGMFSCLFDDNKCKEHIHVTASSISEATKYAEDHLDELTKDMEFRKDYNIDRIECVDFNNETVVLTSNNSK